MQNTMIHAELEQVKADVESGVMISRETWKRVLESAIIYQIGCTLEELDAIYFDGKKNMQQDSLYPGYQVPVEGHRLPSSQQKACEK